MQDNRRARTTLSGHHIDVPKIGLPETSDDFNLWHVDESVCVWFPRAMQSDGRVLEILDRKRAWLDTVGATRDYATWFAELPPFLRWVLSVPTLHAYVKQLLAMHERDEAELERVVNHAIATLPVLATELRDAFPEVSNDDDEDEPFQWGSFDRMTVGASKSSNLAALRDLAEEMADLFRERLGRIWRSEVQGGPNGERIKEIYERAIPAIDVVTFAIREWNHLHATSPRTALIRLIDFCRALQPPHHALKHWTNFAPRDSGSPHIDSDDLKQNIAQHWSEATIALGRFVGELHVLGASTLSRRVLVERFKERCTWYDKARLREVAENGRGMREDRLTLELARYLHDAGLFVLVRPRVSNLEPDIVGLQGIAVEAKAYVAAGSARADIVHGFYQLHAYMTSLETEAMRATEGFLVAFRLGGPIYETPPTIDTGRFLIHSLTIDLGDSADSGRKQPPTATITEDEIMRALAGPSDKAVRSTALANIGSAHSTRQRLGVEACAKRRRWPDLARRRGGRS
jgi:hypothetical protein